MDEKTIQMMRVRARGGRIDKQAVNERNELESSICAPLKMGDSTTKGGKEQHEDLLTDL